MTERLLAALRILALAMFATVGLAAAPVSAKDAKGQKKGNVTATPATRGHRLPVKAPPSPPPAKGTSGPSSGIHAPVTPSSE